MRGVARGGVLEELIGRLPEEDADALRKYWGGSLPPAGGLGEAPALLVVDMTRGFIEDAFPMGWSSTGRPCVEAIARLVESARWAGCPVVFTRGSPFHLEVEYGSRLRGRGLESFPQGVLEEEHHIVPELSPLDGEVVLTKAKPSAFFGTQLEAILTYWRVDTVIVTGMVTSGCIRATVNDAFSLNYRVVIPVECVADRSQVSHLIELVDMGVKYADLVRLDELVAEIRARPEPGAPTGAGVGAGPSALRGTEVSDSTRR